MTPALTRRWFTFNLRTVFVMMTIVGWGLATRPLLITVENSFSMTGVSNGPDAPASIQVFESEQTETLLGITFFLYPDEDGWSAEYGLNPRLRWPLIVFAAFVGWGIIQRVRAWWVERQHQNPPAIP